VKLIRIINSWLRSLVLDDVDKSHEKPFPHHKKFGSVKKHGDIKEKRIKPKDWF